MKVLLQNMIFLFVLVNLFSINIFSQIENSNLSKTNLSNISNVDSNKVDINLDDNFCWRNSIYISTGYGTPQGLRLEIGYNIGTVLSLAVTVGSKDNWSRNPERGTLGIIGKIHFLQIQSVASYILFGYGGTIAFMGEPDSYKLLLIGSKITLIKWLQLCPEIGFVFTTKHISGGKGVFGGSSPIIKEDKTRVGFNISFEIDF